jgi:two-component system nitrogen regulation response regulator GlnG
MAPGQTVEIPDLPQDLLPSGEQGNGIATTAHRAEAEPYIRSASEATLLHHSHISVPDRQLHPAQSWIELLEEEAMTMLSQGQPEVIVKLGDKFEAIVIKAALKYTHGRKNDAAVRLGIGRNTITRKIHELGIDGAKDD